MNPICIGPEEGVREGEEPKGNFGNLAGKGGICLILTTQEVTSLDGRRLAKQRDRRLVELVGEYRYLTAEQVCQLEFGSIKNGIDKARKRLKSLTERGKIKRYQPDGPSYVYYMEQKSQKVGHWLMLNQFLIELRTQRRQWQKIDRLNVEFTLADLLIDIFLIWIGTQDGPRKKFFIEVDHDEVLARPIKKIDDLLAMYKAMDWAGDWWADINHEGAARFPRVVIVTDPGRKEKLEEHIMKVNDVGLSMVVTTMDVIKKDILGVLK